MQADRINHVRLLSVGGRTVEVYGNQRTVDHHTRANANGIPLSEIDLTTGTRTTPQKSGWKNFLSSLFARS